MKQGKNEKEFKHNQIKRPTSQNTGKSQLLSNSIKQLKSKKTLTVALSLPVAAACSAGTSAVDSVAGAPGKRGGFIK